jgi:uncharacterized protein (AIM24 family)
MRDQLLGATQPVLSISLEPGESIVAGPGSFSWMTDSILMSASADGIGHSPALGHTLAQSSLPLSAYTARGVAGTIAFASRLPGSIVGIDVTPGTEYLLHRRGFLAGTPGIEITTGYQQPYDDADGQGEQFLLRRIAGCGRAWVELSGDVVRRDLAAGASLRTHPWHIGMFETSVAVQMAELPGVHADDLGNEASRFAVLSGPGAVWLQSMSLLVSLQARSAALASASAPALEGGAGAHHPPHGRP